MGPAWDEALSADRPCVLDVKTDPNVPPLPPNITYEQAKQYAEALLQGAPEAVGIVWQSLKAGHACCRPVAEPTEPGARPDRASSRRGPREATAVRALAGNRAEPAAAPGALHAQLERREGIHEEQADP